MRLTSLRARIIFGEVIRDWCTRTELNRCVYRSRRLGDGKEQSGAVEQEINVVPQEAPINPPVDISSRCRKFECFGQGLLEMA